MLENLKKSIANANNPNFSQQGADDLLRNFHNKITLISKYPKIKDPKKKMIVSNADFKYTSLKDVIKPVEVHKKVHKESTWDKIWKDGDAKQYEKRFE